MIRARLARVPRAAPSSAGCALAPDEAVEQRALLGRREQRLVRVLTVQIDEPAAALGELGDRREPAVDVAARASDGGDDAREHDLVVAVLEPAFDARFVRALAHELRIGAPAAEEVERVDDQRLARAGLAGDHGRAPRRASRSARR